MYRHIQTWKLINFHKKNSIKVITISLFTFNGTFFATDFFSTKLEKRDWQCPALITCCLLSHLSSLLFQHTDWWWTFQQNDKKLKEREGKIFFSQKLILGNKALAPNFKSHFRTFHMLSTVGPHYMRSFSMKFCFYAIETCPFL